MSGTKTRGGLFGVVVPALDGAEAPLSTPCDPSLCNNKLRQFPGDPTCVLGTGGGDGRRNEEKVSSGGAAPARKAAPRAANEGREGARENGLRKEALLGAEALTGVSGARMRSRDDLADGSSSECKTIKSDSANRDWQNPQDILFGLRLLRFLFRMTISVEVSSSGRTTVPIAGRAA